MDLDVIKLDGSHDRHRMRMASTSERDRYKRVFPDPMPSTHHLVYRWVETTEGMFLHVGPEPIVAGTGETTKAAKDLHADPREKLRVELQMKKREDLLTLCAENEISYERKASNAQIIAALVDKMIPKKPEPATV